MNKKVISLLLVTGMVITAAGVYLIQQTQSGSTDKATRSPVISYEVPNRPAFDTSQLTGDIYQWICQIGYPMFVTHWDLDDTQFLFFKGPFKDNNKPEGEDLPLSLSCTCTE